MDASNAFPEGWRPQPGDSIKGKVVDLDVRDGAYGRYPLVTLETDRGQVTVHAFHEGAGVRAGPPLPQAG